MRKQLIETGGCVLLAALAAGAARFDLGLVVFPVFGEGLRLGLGLVFVPALGILYGPLRGGLAALAAAWLGQYLYPEIAFAGPYTYLLAPVIALSCGWVRRRNWILSLLLGGAVLAFWIAGARGLDAGLFTQTFGVSVLVLPVVAGIFGTDFYASENYFLAVVGCLLLVVTGLAAGVFLGAGLALRYYDLPPFTWSGINLFSFLTYQYILSLLAVFPVVLLDVVLPHAGFPVAPGSRAGHTGVLRRRRRKASS